MGAGVSDAAHYRLMAEGFDTAAIAHSRLSESSQTDDAKAAHLDDALRYRKLAKNARQAARDLP